MGRGSINLSTYNKLQMLLHYIMQRSILYLKLYSAQNELTKAPKFENPLEVTKQAEDI